MSLVVPTVALNAILNEILNRPNLKLKLFSNNVTPGPSTTNASFTEVSGGGYAAVTLTFANWVVSAGVATYPQIEFDFTGATTAPGTIYGYYIVDTDDVTFIWAERFSDSIVPVIVADGSIGKITPRIEAAA